MTDRTMPEPGPEMDALVAGILGLELFDARWKWANRCSTERDASMAALDEWCKQEENRWYSIEGNGSNKACVKLFWGDWHFIATVMAPALAQAICEAIIRAHWAQEDAG